MYASFICLVFSFGFIFVCINRSFRCQDAVCSSEDLLVKRKNFDYKEDIHRNKRFFKGGIPQRFGRDFMVSTDWYCISVAWFYATESGIKFYVVTSFILKGIHPTLALILFTLLLSKVLSKEEKLDICFLLKVNFFHICMENLKKIARTNTHRPVSPNNSYFIKII